MSHSRTNTHPLSHEQADAGISGGGGARVERAHLLRRKPAWRASSLRAGDEYVPVIKGFRVLH